MLDQAEEQLVETLDLNALKASIQTQQKTCELLVEVMDC